jgi:hypothetical protein
MPFFLHCYPCVINDFRIQILLVWRHNHACIKYVYQKSLVPSTVFEFDWNQLKLSVLAPCPSWNQPVFFTESMQILFWNSALDQHTRPFSNLRVTNLPLRQTKPRLITLLRMDGDNVQLQLPFNWTDGWFYQQCRRRSEDNVLTTARDKAIDRCKSPRDWTSGRSHARNYVFDSDSKRLWQRVHIQLFT